MDGETVLIRARVQTSRAQGSKMVFLILRQRTDSVQALLMLTPEKVSKQMLKWASSLQDESIVLVEGVVRKSPEVIKSATVGDVELHLTKVSFTFDSIEGVEEPDNVPGTDPSYLWTGRPPAIHRGGRQQARG